MTTSNANTVRLHRVLRSTPERVYRAFLDADAMAKWLPPNGFTGKVHQVDAKVGGGYKMSFTNFSTGSSHSFGGTYLELKPHERIRYTSKFDVSGLPGEMQTTIILKQVFCGTNPQDCQYYNCMPRSHRYFPTSIWKFHFPPTTLSCLSAHFQRPVPGVHG